MKTLSVSVALCTYNGAKYLRQQLESILKQTVLPEEIIVYDDCSSDDSVEIVKETLSLEQIPFHIYLNSQRVGYIQNFEKCTKACNGEVIFWCDQDDIWFENRIETMLKPFVERPNCKYVYCDAIVINEERKVLSNSLNTALKLGAKTFSEIEPGHYPYGCEVALRKDYILTKIPFVDPHDRVAATGLTSEEVVAINKPLMYYRRHDDAVTSCLSPWKKSKRGINSHIKRFHEIEKRAWFDDPEVKLKEYNRYCENAHASNNQEELKNRIEYETQLVYICNESKWEGIKKLKELFKNHLYRFRGGKKQFILDLAYLLIHSENKAK